MPGAELFEKSAFASLQVARAVFFLSLFSDAIIWAIMPTLLRVHNIDPVWLGLTLAGSTMATIITTPLYVWWYNRRTAVEVLTAGLMCMLVGSLTFGISVSGPSLLCSRLLLGAGAGIQVPLLAVVRDLADENDRKSVQAKTMLLGLLAFVTGAGASSAVVMQPLALGGSVQHALRWTGFVPGICAFMCLGSVSYFFTDPPDKTFATVFSPLQVHSQFSSAIRPLLVCLLVATSVTCAAAFTQQMAVVVGVYALEWSVETASTLLMFVPASAVIALATQDICRRWVCDRTLVISALAAVVLGSVLCVGCAFGWGGMFVFGCCVVSGGCACAALQLVHVFMLGLDKVSLEDESQSSWMQTYYVYSAYPARLVTPTLMCVIFLSIGQLWVVITLIVVSLGGLVLFFHHRVEIMSPEVDGDVLPAADPMELAGSRILGDRGAFLPGSGSYMQGLAIPGMAGYRTFEAPPTV